MVTGVHALRARHVPSRKARLEFFRKARRLKILHIIQSIDPKGGGPAQVAVRLAAAQASLGHDVHVVAYADPEADFRTRQQIDRVPYRSLFKLHLLPKFGRAEALLARGASRVINDLLEGAGWVHCHGVWESILRVAAESAYKAGVPYCFRPAGMLDPWSLDQRKWKKKVGLALGTRRVLRRAKFIHALNHDEARLIAPLKLGVPTCIIPNGIFLEEVEPLPARGTFRIDHPELADYAYVLFLGRLHWKKGLDYLADAFALLAERLPSVRLVVAGPDDGHKANFEAHIHRHNLGDRVRLVGPLYGPNKFAALADASCFCLPSRQEGFSVAVLEAMAAGVPVVISEACHFPEAASSRAGVIAPLEPSAIAAAIESILLNPSRAASMSSAGQNLIRNHYTWPRIAEQLTNLYEQSSWTS
jgi:glycosyltransferase involved in cell wall biosynthesis